MPEEGKTYTSKILITGNIDEKLMASIKQLVGHNGTVIKQAKEIGKESKEGFKLFEKGAELAECHRKGWLR